MGAGESTLDSDSEKLDYRAGYRVIHVHEGSPCAEVNTQYAAQAAPSAHDAFCSRQAQLDVFFDFIVKANEVLLVR
jgi:hypothetical protein